MEWPFISTGLKQKRDYGIVDDVWIFTWYCNLPTVQSLSYHISLNLLHWTERRHKDVASRQTGFANALSHPVCVNLSTYCKWHPWPNAHRLAFKAYKWDHGQHYVSNTDSLIIFAKTGLFKCSNRPWSGFIHCCIYMHYRWIASNKSVN